MAASNPFTFGPMITDPDRFIGRRAELEIIMARLNGTQPQGSAVVGPRRMGKSSLLHYLYQPRSDEVLRSAPNQRVLYLDAQQGECHTPEAFRHKLIKILLTNVQLDRRTSDGKRLVALQTHLNTAIQCDWGMAREAITLVPFHPVICLDEFETLLKGGFDNRFFDALRSWANEGVLTWITVSAQPLTILGKEHNLTSPFFNLLATVQLAGLTDDEVDTLLDQANPTTHRFTPGERRLIRNLAGNHPYHLQIVSWQMWEDKVHNRRITRKTLQKFLCQQPNPPSRCAKRTSLHTGWKAAIALLFLVVVLAAILIWRDPVFVRGIMTACWTWLRTVLSYWDETGDTGQRIGGILYLVAGIVVVIIGIKQRRRLGEIVGALWEKWTP